jgi:YbgC/YbaW family acyl-CoA thioester hydrolase
MKQAEPHRTTLTVRGYELDSYGHVNNAVYLQYLEQARWEFIRGNGVYEALLAHGMLLVITETTIRYKREALLFDELEIETHCELKSPFVIFHQKIVNRQSGLTVARASVKSVFLDRERIPQDIPHVMIALFNPPA